MVLGGGGYTIRNVSRAWAYETAVLLDEDVSNNIPYNDYFEFYAPSFKLHLEPDADLDNANSREYLEECKYVLDLTEVRKREREREREIG